MFPDFVEFKDRYNNTFRLNRALIGYAYRQEAILYVRLSGTHETDSFSLNSAEEAINALNRVTYGESVQTADIATQVVSPAITVASTLPPTSLDDNF